MAGRGAMGDGLAGGLSEDDCPVSAGIKTAVVRVEFAFYVEREMLE
jgi:hypothetical protein